MLTIDLNRVYGKWRTEGHQFFPLWEFWEFREDGTLHLTSEEDSMDATGRVFTLIVTILCLLMSNSLLYLIG